MDQVGHQKFSPPPKKEKKFIYWNLQNMVLEASIKLTNATLNL